MKHGLIFTLLLIPVFQFQSSLKAAFVSSEFSSVRLNVYPNPFTDAFTIESADTDVNLEVFTLSGRKVPTTLYKYHHDGLIRYETGRELSRGLYLVKVRSEGSAFFQKMMKIE